MVSKFFCLIVVDLLFLTLKYKMVESQSVSVCDMLQKFMISNANVIREKGSDMDEIKYQCYDTFELIGDSKIRCNRKLNKFVPNIPKCVVKEDKQSKINWTWKQIFEEQSNWNGDLLISNNQNKLTYANMYNDTERHSISLQAINVSSTLTNSEFRFSVDNSSEIFLKILEYIESDDKIVFQPNDVKSNHKYFLKENWQFHLTKMFVENYREFEFFGPISLNSNKPAVVIFYNISPETAPIRHDTSTKMSSTTIGLAIGFGIFLGLILIAFIIIYLVKFRRSNSQSPVPPIDDYPKDIEFEPEPPKSIFKNIYNAKMTLQQPETFI